MSEKRVWFITGAGRGMGVDIAKAALAAGNAVVATGRNPVGVTEALGEAHDLLVAALDITKPEQAGAAVQRLWIASAGSTCWSTTRATSTQASSRS